MTRKDVTNEKEMLAGLTFSGGEYNIDIFSILFLSFYDRSKRNSCCYWFSG